MAKSLQALVLDYKRQEILNECVSQAREMQANGDLSGALAKVEEVLASCPSEVRLVQLRTTLRNLGAVSPAIAFAGGQTGCDNRVPVSESGPAQTATVSPAADRPTLTESALDPRSKYGQHGHNAAGSGRSPKPAPGERWAGRPETGRGRLAGIRPPAEVATGLGRTQRRIVQIAVGA